MRPSCDQIAPNAPITERDIVSELYWRLRVFCEGYKELQLSTHTEIMPVSPLDEESRHRNLERLNGNLVDVVILQDTDRNWLSAATKVQGYHGKRKIEARFKSVPIEFFHTAIEVKIQSNPKDAQSDIDKLLAIRKNNEKCNCFMVLLNARGRRKDHDEIISYAAKQGITLIEHTTRT